MKVDLWYMTAKVEVEEGGRRGSVPTTRVFCFLFCVGGCVCVCVWGGTLTCI